MNMLETIKTSLRAIIANKMRSGLTVLGIIIGVAAVISLMSIGRGAQAAVTSNIESLGTNLLFVTAGASTQGFVRGGMGSASSLTLEDVAAINNSEIATAIKATAPQYQTFAQVINGKENTFTQIIGVTADYQTVRNFTVAQGAFITDNDVNKKTLVAVLGSSVAETLFGTDDPVGQTVKIGGKKFTVIGVLKSKGSTSAGSSSDDMILAPITTVQSRISSMRVASGSKNVQTIYVQVVSADKTDLAINQLTTILREQHGLAATAADDFTISSQQDTIDSLKASTQIWVLFLGAISGISLLVGGIGIMNIMLVSVTERTREIGIRKSIGAKKRDILLQFLVESGLLSLTGGGIGVLAGLGISHAVSGLNFGGTTITTTVSVDILVLAVSVSAAIGIVFGLYPAYRAAKLNPIEALRYE
ncbi:MAG: ABC transporter permease [Dehalococcoidales bacterium]|nr:ABC transporter permease [Dehalococcoidales bacterium]